MYPEQGSNADMLSSWLQIAAEMGSLGDNKKIQEEYAQLETKKKKLCREQVRCP